MTEAEYALLKALIAVLPHGGYWTRAEREKWLSALVVLLDLCIEQVPDEPRTH